MKTLVINIIFFTIILNYPPILFAQNNSPADTFPVPPKNPDQLFYLQRQPNSNTLIYALNIKNNQIDELDPVKVYWIRYQEKGQRQELSWLQRTFAYGIHSKKISNTEYELNLVSYKKQKFRLEKDPVGIWRVFTIFSNGKKVVLKRVYVHVNGGSFWHPNIEYVEIKGLDLTSNKEVRERLKIK